MPDARLDILITTAADLAAAEATQEALANVNQEAEAVGETAKAAPEWLGAFTQALENLGRVAHETSLALRTGEESNRGKNRKFHAASTEMPEARPTTDPIARKGAELLCVPAAGVGERHSQSEIPGRPGVSARKPPGNSPNLEELPRGFADAHSDSRQLGATAAQSLEAQLEIMRTFSNQLTAGLKQLAEVQRQANQEALAAMEGFRLALEEQRSAIKLLRSEVNSLSSALR